MGRPKTRTFAVRNLLEDLAPLARDLGAFCRYGGMTEEEFADVRLALEEAVSNTIRHGYPDAAGSRVIRIRASLKRDSLRLDIEDDARPFNPVEAPLPDVNVPVEEKTPGGLGILLLRSVMSRVEYRRRGAKNRLRLVRARRP